MDLFLTKSNDIFFRSSCADIINMSLVSTTGSTVTADSDIVDAVETSAR